MLVAVELRAELAGQCRGVVFLVLRAAQYLFQDVDLPGFVVDLGRKHRHAGCNIEVPDSNERPGRIVNLLPQSCHQMAHPVEAVVYGHVVGLDKIPVAVQQALLGGLVADLVQRRFVGLSKGDIGVVED